MTFDELLDAYAEAVRYDERADDRLTASERAQAQKDLIDTRNAVVERVRVLEAALRQYANSARWHATESDVRDLCGWERLFDCCGDGYEIARAALAGTEPAKGDGR